MGDAALMRAGPEADPETAGMAVTACISMEPLRKPICWTIYVLAVGEAPSFQMKGPVQELQTKLFAFKGTPGDTFGIFVTPVLSTQFFYGLKGQRLFSWSPQPLLMIVGTIPGSGSNNKFFQIPDMGPGFQTTSVHIQAIFGNASGEVVLGPQQTLIVLDAVY
jgi:hypothetical protein